MIIKNSMKQLFRTPVKTILFIVLLTLSTVLISLGGNLWKYSRDNLKRFSELFTTIGTVEQKSSNLNRVAQWDAGLNAYRYSNVKEYDKYIGVDALDIEGANYLSGPERRPYYAAYVPGYRLISKLGGWSTCAIVEASPIEDCIPSGPVKMEIKNTLFSYYKLNMVYFYFCDHYNPNPEMLYADKTYVIDIADALPHGWVPGAPVGRFEYVPLSGIHSDQTDENGQRLANQLPECYIEEVTDNFYQTEHGKMWLALAKERENMYHTVPVTPTNDLNLMMPFHEGDAYLAEGNAFSKEDYQAGNKVCLISGTFARRNDIKVHDTISLPLRYANYESPANIGMWWAFYEEFGHLNAKGTDYQTFEDGEYEIIGIYEITPGASEGSDYGLHENEIIIPMASVKHSDRDHIATFGPMRDYTTSFQIPNGTIDEFMTLWNQVGNKDLEISFHDGGYSKLESGLLNIRKMSFILLGVGTVTAILILLFFCYMLITKQKYRTAIERSMGMSKKQCAMSLLAGIMLLSVIGSSIGSMSGFLLTAQAVERMGNVQRFDDTFSVGSLDYETEVDEEVITTTPISNASNSILIGLTVIAFTLIIAIWNIRKNLKEEPLKLLSNREEV